MGAIYLLIIVSGALILVGIGVMNKKQPRSRWGLVFVVEGVAGAATAAVLLALAAQMQAQPEAAAPVWPPAQFTLAVTMHPETTALIQTPDLSLPAMATTTPTRNVDCPPPPGWEIITVADDETLETIAAKYEVGINELKLINCLIVDVLPPGAMLYVPVSIWMDTPTPCVVAPPDGWLRYTVKPGDTFYSLANMYAIPSTTLMRVNCYQSPSDLSAEAQIWIPFMPIVTATLGDGE